MNKEIREYDKNVQFEIGQRIQEMRLDKKMCIRDRSCILMVFIWEEKRAF